MPTAREPRYVAIATGNKVTAFKLGDQRRPKVTLSKPPASTVPSDEAVILEYLDTNFSAAAGTVQKKSTFPANCFGEHPSPLENDVLNALGD